MNILRIKTKGNGKGNEFFYFSNKTSLLFTKVKENDIFCLVFKKRKSFSNPFQYFLIKTIFSLFDDFCGNVEEKGKYRKIHFYKNSGSKTKMILNKNEFSNEIACDINSFWYIKRKVKNIENVFCRKDDYFYFDKIVKILAFSIFVKVSDSL